MTAQHQDAVGHAINDTANGAIAMAAATSPFWLPILREVSLVAGLIVPILGAVLLLLQIAKLVLHFVKPHTDLDSGVP